jgi:hypothetical protein
MESGPTAAEAILIALAGGLIGSLATGLIRLFIDAANRRRRRRVAARAFYGDIAVAEAAFQSVLKSKQWPDFLDFNPALLTWREFRADLAAGVTALEWTYVGAFYSNLERAALRIRHGEQCNDNDLSVAKAQVAYATDALKIAAAHTAKRKNEQDEVIKELGAPPPKE